MKHLPRSLLLPAIQSARDLFVPRGYPDWQTLVKDEAEMKENPAQYPKRILTPLVLQALSDPLGSKANYLKQVEAAARQLLREGFLLSEDAERLVLEARARSLGF